ncbi:unnamed protein product [Polarella glacialis]|uniref:Uncharacterized protein n=1 Tax=Polarella glacialis TaxID=89957 RepID=A0A813GQ93_POLGL|nr:unnamed protein product [Polarella glacialis]
MEQLLRSSQRPAAERLRAAVTQKRAELLADTFPARIAVKFREAPQGARLRWGRGHLGSAARAAAEEREAAERLAERQVTHAVGRSPIGLYPVYDCPRQVAGVFTGTKVLQPAALRHALIEAAKSAPRSAAGDGRAFLADGSDKVCFEEIEEVEVIEGDEEEDEDE